jgi:transcriptional antiterminator NusG
MKSYCIYCKTGSEAKLVFLLKKDMKDLEHVEVNLMFPVRIMHQKRRGVWAKVEQPLLPGYVFMYVEDADPFPAYVVRLERDAFRILRNPDMSMELQGSDEDYARWVFNHQGRFEPSKVVFKEGQLVKVLSGPLLDMKGRLVKIDRHHKRVVVAFQFAGQERRINLGIDVIEQDAAAAPGNPYTV